MTAPPLSARTTRYSPPVGVSALSGHPDQPAQLYRREALPGAQGHAAKALAVAAGADGAVPGELHHLARLYPFAAGKGGRHLSNSLK